MPVDVNKAKPLVMHIDLNSAFAMIEQQANPHLRGKPVAITNRLTRGATIIAASYEAKQYGVGVGTKLADAHQRIPNLVALETDPPKYIYAHNRFKAILRSYSPDAHMKSVDEGVIDFGPLQLLHKEPLTKIASDIKQQLKSALGEWMTCNIGVAPNRYLAKVAAGLQKPDGLDIIDHTNLVPTLRALKLTDLTGIKARYGGRLMAHGIFTPLGFLAADERKLSREVFKSINGYYWYLRLRGWEVDAGSSQVKTIGRQYVLHEWTDDPKKLAAILLKMCERLGRRLRSQKLCAKGLYLACGHLNGEYWHARKKWRSPLFSTQELYLRALALMSSRPEGETVKFMSITCYDLAPASSPQLTLFAGSQAAHWQLMATVDELNNRFGELTVVPAAMLGTERFVPDKIPFGTTRYFKDEA